MNKTFNSRLVVVWCCVVVALWHCGVCGVTDVVVALWRWLSCVSGLGTRNLKPAVLSALSTLRRAVQDAEAGGETGLGGLASFSLKPPENNMIAANSPSIAKLRRQLSSGALSSTFGSSLNSTGGDGELSLNSDLSNSIGISSNGSADPGPGGSSEAEVDISEEDREAFERNLNAALLNFDLSTVQEDSQPMGKQTEASASPKVPRDQIEEGGMHHPSFNLSEVSFKL
jgi:hypothetical protein